MKTTKLSIWLLAFAIVASITLNSCSEEEVFDQDEYEELSQDLAKAKKPDIILKPSGDPNGITDADAIENALNTLPSKGVLLLKKGTFFINRTIVAPDSFNGTISGKGKSKTEIVGVGDIGTPFMVADPFIPTGPNFFLNEAYFHFYNPEGNVAMNHLSMSIPVDMETNGDNNHRLFVFISTVLGDNEADTHFSELKLTGKEFPDFPNIDNSPVAAIAVFGNNSTYPTPTSGGKHTVTNCKISEIAFPPTAHSGFKDAKILLQGNTCFNVRQTRLSRLEGCKITVEENNIKGFDISAINFFQEGQSIHGKTNKVEIKNNSISSNAYMAIEINGPIADGDADYEVEIKNNVLENLGEQSLFGFPNLAVIGIFEGNEKVDVKDNIILGSADYGILQISDNGKFKANDLSDFNAASSFDYKLEGDDNELKDIGNSTVDDQGTGNKIKN